MQQGFAVGAQHVVFQFRVFVTAHLGNLFHLAQAVLNRFEIFQLKFCVDDFFVAHGVYAAVHMHHVVIVEAAQHMDNGVRFANIAEELVAETFTLRCAFYEACDVYDFHGGRHDAPWVYQFGEF